MSPAPRVLRNDWSSVAVPDLAGWQPTMTVSVVIPAFEGQPMLDLTLASLRDQTYPTDLLEVIVVDDGSDPPVQLPAVRPERTTLLRVREGWGKANAQRIGVAHSTGEILHLLDADMVVFPEHVAALARWQHTLPYAVTLGYKRFVDSVRHGPWPSQDEVVDAWTKGAADRLFGGSPASRTATRSVTSRRPISSGRPTILPSESTSGPRWRCAAKCTTPPAAPIRS